MITFKVVKGSNFDDENYAEKFVENLPDNLDRESAMHIATAINDCLFGADHKDFYRAVESTYILNPGFQL